MGADISVGMCLHRSSYPVDVRRKASVALNKYRVWIFKGVGQEDTHEFKDMDSLVAFLWDSMEIDCNSWGLEKYDTIQNIWVDAFISDDMIAMHESMFELQMEKSSSWDE